MIQLLAYCRSLRLVALALGSLTVAVVSAAPASARTHHSRHAQSAHAGYHARHYANHHYRHAVRLSRWERGVARMRAHDLADANASVVPNTGGVTETSSFGSSGLVAEARRYLGGNPTGRASLWCARFMNMVLKESGYRGTGSDMASSFAKYGQRVSGPQVGAIAVMSRRGGGHVGIITGIDAKGNPIMISGNNGNRVREAPVSRGRIYAYVMPTN
ncbi:TIGR02594 family protein [Bradyrhizobium sp. ISRA443]|uniref:TIGR02594 family protein n=1 Tax=unclassified Bradyrhizobium TaxID=2631580 RepID=UPI00247AC953|nr:MULTISPECIES: TIGR02594 family protein [unclassified Bradyrhizobium]WGR95151.1 TIGR02594 family protein [Bradyrhizobium sp. ISRA435]WGS00066.1 TIGR02594 family protein [Bradyrhizobium sp. ISRA436]WGS06955.1 TIGR02594 family protein [Bradyrhizobium sp. ISRA437]WGS13837.1 TIGR02594 family protein [Bradyrhizobium sp. ISRA443]